MRYPWSQGALCHNQWNGTDLVINMTEKMFPLQGDIDNAPSARVQAKAICNACPCRLPCLDHAIRTNETEGIWGGMTPNERTRYQKRNSP